jgi:SAM-dependent methyltransferase
VTAFDALKQRQSAAWGAAPFERVAEQAGAIHDHLVRELEPQPGERWLDVGTGTGAIAVRAARAGAEVTANDLAPALVETAKRLAAEEGLSIRFEVGDAERLEFPDASFDVVSSSFAAMFAPDHGAVARELARVARPGGRIGLTTWDPKGGIGDFFQILAGFQPPLPEGAGNPLDWGREEHVDALLGEAFDLRYVHGNDPQRGSSPEEIWRLFVTSFGPLKVLYGSLDEERREELHGAFVDFYAAHERDGRVEAPREYVIVLGTRR